MLLDILLRLNSVPTSQTSQPSLRHLVVFIHILIITIVILIVVPTIHQINHQHSSLAHSIELKPSLQDIISIKDTSGEVQIDVGILERKTNLPEVLVMAIRQFVLFCVGTSAVEDEDSFAEGKAKAFSAFFG